VGISVPGVPDNTHPAKVLNLSLGGTGACSAEYQRTVDDVLAQGAVIVASAGNSEGKAVGTPADCTGVIAVLALRHAGTKVGFSDLGPEIAISAPGGNCINIGLNEPCLYPILAANNTGTQGPLASGWSDSYDPTLGTSFASPLVAGTAALMFSARPELTPAQVRSVLQSTARAFPTTGADNGPGNSTPVPQCLPPSNAAQDQCYCTTAVCGAGMLNAGAAVLSAAAFAPPPTVTVSASNAQPMAGTSVTLTATATPGSGRTISGYAWQITAGSSFASLTPPTNAATATLAATAAGSVTVQVTVTDSGGSSTSQAQVVAVQAAVVAPPSNNSGSGGGAISLAWLLGLALAVAALADARARRRRRD
jgi:serine protease